jgi:hypothetical protein
MSRQKGLIKLQSLINRDQQHRDWELILRLVNKPIDPPDWNSSVNKIDIYMARICKENNISFKDVCGVG